MRFLLESFVSSCFRVLLRYYHYYYYYLLIRVFHISVSWWSFTGDWVTASLLKSPGLFSVFCLSLIMLLFGCSPLGHQLPNSPSPLIILSLPCQKRQSQLVLLSPSCSIVFSILYQGQGTYLSFHILSVLFCGLPGQQSRQFRRFSFFFFLLIIIRSGLWAEIRWSVCISKSHRSLCALFSGTGAHYYYYYYY